MMCFCDFLEHHYMMFREITKPGASEDLISTVFSYLSLILSHTL